MNKVIASFGLVILMIAGCDRWSHRSFETASSQKDVFLVRADNPYSVAMPPSEWARLQANLEEARLDYEADPTNEANIIWLARRLGYLGLYHEAIETLTEGLKLHPDSYRLRRHRGHRFITVREFTRAVDDLSRAARLAENAPDEVEPDGAPNAMNLPRSTTKTNIFYHLALAHYLLGDFEAAEAAWSECLMLATNDDMRVAASYWLYLTQRRQDDSVGAATTLAAVATASDIIENHDYFELLLLYQLDKAPDEAELGDDGSVTRATRAYGLAMLHYFHGDLDEAMSMLREIVEGANPAAFGAIAAEVELTRLQ